MLFYHEVSGQRGLEAQIGAFVRSGYQPVSMATLVDALEGTIEPPPGCLVLTFDDGLRSQHRNALPVLTRWEISGTFFVMPGFRDGVHAYMNAEELRELAEAGMEIGSHTLNHASLPALRRWNLGAVWAELNVSRHLLEEITERPIDLFAYPNGSVDAATAAEVEAAGYRAAASTVAGTYQTLANRFVLRRIPANASEAPSNILSRMAR